LFGVLAGAALATPSGARQTVERFHATLLGVMREAATLGYAGRRARLAPAVEASFDLSAISRLVLGRYWKGLDQAQRQRMIAAFTALTVATYAARFDGYSGERFKFVSERDLKRNRVLVRTVLIKQDGDKVRLDYVLHRTGKGWRFINVLADGVSEISIKRADYGAVMRGDGFEALMTKLAAQTAHYAAEAVK